MKIIRLVTLLDFGGLERRMINLSFIKDNNEWVFCAIGKGGEAAHQIEANGKRVILLNQSYKIPSVSAIRALVELFKLEKPDVVHTSGAEANFHGIIAAKISGVGKLISEEIGIPNQKLAFKLAFGFLYKFPDLILANSKPVADYLIQENGVKKNFIQIIPNPLKTSHEKSIPQADTEEFQILTVSRIKTVKNLEGILNVLVSLKKEGHKIKFTVVGDGDHLEKLKKHVFDLDLVSVVEFKGFVPEPLKAIEDTNLFIINSLAEGFSNALAEAMAVGIPCLATDVGAAGDLIQENETGWLVKPGEDQDLFNKLKFILSLEKERLAEVGNNGRNTVKSKYNLSRHVNQLLEVYQN